MSDWLDSDEFYNLMQSYRHAQFVPQAAVSECFEEVKRGIRHKFHLDKWVAAGVSLHEQVVCVRLEIELRERLYPRLVESNKMKQEYADREIGRMRAVLATLKVLEEEWEIFHDMDKFTGEKP